MTKSELVSLIGDILTEIDVVSGSLGQNLPSRKKLDELRGNLDEQQRKLVRLIFKENNSEYINITAELSKTNEEMRKSLNDLQRIVGSIKLLTKFVELVEDATLTASDLVA